MKRFLLTALIALVPATSLAQPAIRPYIPATVTGKVEVVKVRCWGCPAIVSVVDAEGNRTRITGDWREDVEAFEGKTVTVRGEGIADGEMKATGFRPGKSADFIAGTVVDVTNCPPNARCMPKVAIKMGNSLIRVMDQELANKLIQIEGATVSLKGTEAMTRCAPGTRCIGGGHVFYPNTRTNIMVKGLLEKLPHGMNGQTHSLTLGSGETLMVSGKTSWKDTASLWLSGKFGVDPISGSIRFNATSKSDSIVPIPAVDPFFPRPSIEPIPGSIGGANVSRGADTDGAVGGATAGGSSDGAGTAR